MKKIFLVAALAAATLFVSCGKDGNDGFNNEEGPRTGMSISFTMPPSAGTRAVTGDEIAGTILESKFTKLKVFIFNSEGSAVTGNNEERLEADFSRNGNTYTLKTSRQIQTSAGPKRIYIGVNLPETGDFNNFPNEAALKKAVRLISASDMVTANGAAMLSNVIVKTLVAQEDGDVVNPDNHIATTVERMIAKVGANTTTANNKFVAEISTDVSVTYEITRWGIGHGTNYMYPAKQLENGRLVTPRNPESGAPAVNGAPLKTDLVAMSNSTLMDNWDEISSIYVGENAPKNNLIGESTYAMVQSRFAPNKKATLNVTSIDWTAHTFNTDDDVWVVRSAGEIYFCSTSLEASAIYEYLLEDVPTTTIQKYQGGYVYFIVWLNRNITGEELIVERNHYIHLEITNVKEGVFGGIPGHKGDPTGETPPDPTDPTEPQEPDPLDPEDPVFETESYLSVSVTVKPWTYVKNETVLE